MPCADAFGAPVVSSERCAEASKPVIVYCVRITPSGTTYRKNFQPLVPPEKPELFTQWVKTNEALWWDVGPKISTRTMSAAPTTCQYADALFQTDRMWAGNRLRITWISRMQRKIRKMYLRLNAS